MDAKDTFEAWGHSNVRCTHKTTLMVTRDEELTASGDCIVAVRAEKGMKDLDPRLKDLIRNSETRVTFTMEAGGSSFNVVGWGHPRLSSSDPNDIVIRKSGHTCSRTLMIGADKAACDIPIAFVKLLQDVEQRVRLTIQAEIVTQK